jgi:hypothetical protein
VVSLYKINVSASLDIPSKGPIYLDGFDGGLLRGAGDNKVLVLL